MILGEKEKKMEILLQSKTCVFMDDALMIKGGDKPVFYEQIAQVIYEKRYNSYDIVFYNEKIKNARCRFYSTIKKIRKLF